MPFDRFMICPPQGGLQNDVRPYLIPDDAFAKLNNAYVFRGRVRKRFGSRLMNGTVPSAVAQLYSRLRINIGTTDAVTGNFGPFVVPGALLQLGQMFSVGTTMFTVYQVNGATRTTGTATAVYNAGTNTLTITGNNENPTTSVFFYPGTPVMGLISYETNIINDEPVYAFDTQFAYFYTGGGTGAWTRLGTAIWTGSDSQFFWGYTYRGEFDYEKFLFVTNFNTPDRIKYWDGSTWFSMSPITDTISRLYTARIIVSFHGRLVALNTIENEEGIFVANTDAVTGNKTTTATGTFAIGQNFTVGTTIFTINSLAASAQPLLTNTISTGTFNASTGALVITGNNLNPSTPIYYLPNGGGAPKQYANRARWTALASPVNVGAWRDDIDGGGLFLDAWTAEQIITCEFIKDRLIVYFERSTWELAYTGNEVQPFVWQQINSELGSESTFSVIPFDNVAIAIGNVGVHACNGTNVNRIDQKIPSEVFGFSNNNAGTQRVYGIRDYYTEMLYWSYPTSNIDDHFPNRVMVYNYAAGTWAFNDDSITVFGYYQDQNDAIWASMDETWEQSEEQWNAPVLQAKFRDIIAGNQQGFVFIVDPDLSRNAPALQITSIIGVGTFALILTVFNHNLENGDYVCIENVVGVTGVNNNIYVVYGVTAADPNSFTINSDAAGTYLGGGTVARVSVIDIWTKQYNFYMQEARNAYINKVDFLLDKTANGEVRVDSFISSSSESQLRMGDATQSLIGNGILETRPYALAPLERTQDRIWHPIYLQADGECVQLRIYLDPEQVTDPAIAWSDFQMHSMVFYTQRTSSRMQ